MGWTDSHLYLFRKGNFRYGIKFEGEESFESNIENSEDIPLNTLLCKENDKISYEYDFGDSWYHSILLEKSSLPESDWPQIPICIKGKGACPVEDSGGIWGCYQLLENVRDVNNPERDELHEWLMQGIESREYNLNVINARIASYYE